MKRPKGAPSRSVNPLQKLKEEMIRRASADRKPLERSVRKMADERVERDYKNLAGRSNESLAAPVASFLNRGAGEPDSADYPGYVKMQEILGISDPGSVEPSVISDRLRGLNPAQRKEVAANVALVGGPGLLERAARARAGITGMLAEDSTRGDIARVGVVSAATGGSVMGLTAAGQGLMALMEYIQNGTQQQEQRESTLS